MKKFFVTAFKVFWITFFGLEASIISAVFGIVLCASLVGIPFGVKCFQMIPVLFNPCGKDVTNNYSEHKVLNSIWFIPIGFVFWLLYAIVGIVCYISIIFIPVGKQLGKIRRFYFAPFGAEIVDINKE